MLDQEEITSVAVNLTTWLLEQIADDEAAALDVGGPDDEWYSYFRDIKGRRLLQGVTESDPQFDESDVFYAATKRHAAHIVRYDPARVLAEVAAKRALVEIHSALAADDSEYSGWRLMAVNSLRALAIPYANRPGFRDDWVMSQK